MPSEPKLKKLWLRGYLAYLLVRFGNLLPWLDGTR